MGKSWNMSQFLSNRKKCQRVAVLVFFAVENSAEVWFCGCARAKLNFTKSRTPLCSVRSLTFIYHFIRIFGSRFFAVVVVLFGSGLIIFETAGYKTISLRTIDFRIQLAIEAGLVEIKADIHLNGIQFYPIGSYVAVKNHFCWYCQCQSVNAVTPTNTHKCYL